MKNLTKIALPNPLNNFTKINRKYFKISNYKNTRVYKILFVTLSDNNYNKLYV